MGVGEAMGLIGGGVKCGRGFGLAVGWCLF